MTLQSSIFDGLSDRYGNGSVEHMMFLGEMPPCAVRVTIRIQDVRRMFIATILETDGVGSIDVIELDTSDEETVVSVDDNAAQEIGQVVANVMAQS